MTQWRKSSRSEGGTSGECIELATLDEGIGIRDSKAPAAGRLTVNPEVLAGVARVKAGQLDK
ncbi:hypothetical protein GCM10010191_81710 [Actinomadura vinacea]|uniref:DUF397 domain-containing protein n=1 Tax=Actinomadura vinacea TaxID=115336 RepID=A0ABN3K714_9ACTN